MLDWLLGAPLNPGTPAPAFSLKDEGGATVALEVLRGKNVVLVFYPADDTAVCTKQLCEFRDSWAQATGSNTVVFGVNPAGAAKHGKFRERHQLPFPLLIDEGQQVAKLYGASAPGFVRRTVYLIGPDGVIRYARRGKPAPAEVLAAAA